MKFEDFAIPLMEKYGGKIMYRLRPNADNYIVNKKEDLPYEIHVISFDSDSDLMEFMNDDKRLEFIHLKNESVKSTLLIKGKLV